MGKDRKPNLPLVAAALATGTITGCSVKPVDNMHQAFEASVTTDICSKIIDSNNDPHKINAVIKEISDNYTDPNIINHPVSERDLVNLHIPLGNGFGQYDFSTLTPLDVAVGMGTNFNIVEALIDAGAIPTQNTLAYAMTDNNILILALVEKHASEEDINAVRSYLQSPDSQNFRDMRETMQDEQKDKKKHQESRYPVVGEWTASNSAEQQTARGKGYTLE